VAAPIPLYRPEVALYTAVPAVARQLGITSLGTFHDRNGDQSLLTGNGVVSAAWARAFGANTSQQWSGAASPSFDGSITGLQSGLDLLGRETDTGHRDRIGLLASYGRASGRVNGFSGGFQDVAVGSLSIDATSIGAYWTHIGPSGWYVDAVAMHSWYTGSPFSSQGLTAATNGTGVIASLEGGFPIAITAHLTLEPQAQLLYQHLALGPTQDIVSNIDFGRSDALSGRIGARMIGTYQTTSALLQPYLKVNIWRDFDGRDTTTFAASDAIDTQRGATAFEVGGGITAKLSQALAVFAAAGYTTNLDSNHRETIQGHVGVRVAW
jgi:outer membrane autotransporter protein